MREERPLSGYSDDKLLRELKRREGERSWEQSWQDLRGKIIDREKTIQTILASPTSEERKRWEGKSNEEILQDIRAYIAGKEDAHIRHLRMVAEIDGIARDMHIMASPRLRGLR